MMRPNAAHWHLRQELHWLALWGQLKVNIFAFYNSQDGPRFPDWSEGGTQSLYGPSEVNNKSAYPEGIAQCQHYASAVLIRCILRFWWKKQKAI